MKEPFKMTQTMQPDDPGAETTVEVSTVGERVLHDLVSYGVGITRDGEHISIDDVFTYPEIPLPSVHPVDLVVGKVDRGILAENLRRSVEDVVSFGVGITRDGKHIPVDEVFDCSGETPLERTYRGISADILRRSIEDAGRKQAAQDPSVWDLPDPAIRGAARMQAEIVRVLWARHAKTGLEQIRCGFECAIEAVEALDPAKVVE